MKKRYRLLRARARIFLIELRIEFMVRLYGFAHFSAAKTQDWLVRNHLLEYAHNQLGIELLVLDRYDDGELEERY